MSNLGRQRIILLLLRSICPRGCVPYPYVAGPNCDRLAQDVNHLKCVMGLAAVRDERTIVCVRMIPESLRKVPGRDNLESGRARCSARRGWGPAGLV
ncbi:hypothetical protein LY78DRAFT_306782 [Colletotrichum sublineola]|nr:hypothetical protein LY78DRAFT_306782 [Colletotrichum sublineola]